MNPEILNLVVGGDFSGASAALDALAGKFSSKLSKMAGVSKAAAGAIATNFSQIVGYMYMLQQPLSTKNMETYSKRMSTLMKSVSPPAIKGKEPSVEFFKDKTNMGDPFGVYREQFKLTIDEIRTNINNLQTVNKNAVASFSPIAKSLDLYSNIADAFRPENIKSVQDFNTAMIAAATSTELAKTQAEGLKSVLTGMSSFKTERKGATGLTADLFKSPDFKNLQKDYYNLLKRLPAMKLGSPEGTAAVTKVNNELADMIQKMTRVKALQESINAERAKGVPADYMQSFQQSKYYTAFADIQTGVGEQLKEKGADFEAIMQGAQEKLSAATTQANELRNVLVKIAAEEQKRQIAKTAAKTATEIELAANKELLSVAGVMIDKSNMNYAIHSRVQQAVETLREAEIKVNAEFDKELIKRKDILNTMIRTNQSAEVIEQYGITINNLEKQRASALDKISSGMLKIKQTMETTKGYFAMEREAKTLLNMSRNILTANNATHTFRAGLEKLSSATIRLGKVQNEFIRFFSRWRNRLLVLTFTFAGLIRSVQRFITLSAEADKQMASLAVVASNTGVSITKVTQAAEYLARDGVISIEDAGQALKNLLSTGANLDVITENLETMKDAAMANGRATYTVGENIIAFTQGVKEEKSQLTDSAGVMTNLSNIVKKYSSEIKELGRANGILIGFTKEAMQFEGARAKVLETLSGKMQVMKASILVAKKALGQLMQPIGTELVSNVFTAVTQVEKYAKDNALQLKNYAVNTAKAIKDILGGIVTVGKVALSVFSPLIAGVLALGRGLAWVANTKFFRGVAFVAIHLKLVLILVPKLTAALAVMKTMLINVSLAWDVFNHKMLTASQKYNMLVKVLGFGKIFTAVATAGVLVALEVILSKLIKIWQQQKELKLIDEERLKLSESLLYNYEEMSKIQGVILKLKEKEKKLGEVATVKQYAEQFARIQQLKKEVEVLKKEAATVPSSETKRVLANYVSKRKELSLQEESFNKIKGFYKEEFDLLKEWGYSITGINNGMLEIRNTSGEIINAIDMEHFETWYELMSDINGKTSGISQISDEIKGKFEKIVTDVEKLRDEVDAISDNAAKQKILSFVNEYQDAIRTASKEQQEMNNNIEQSGKYYSDIVAIMGRYIQQAITLKQITLGTSVEGLLKEANPFNKMGLGDLLATGVEKKGMKTLLSLFEKEDWEGVIAQIKYMSQLGQATADATAGIINYAREEIRLKKSTEQLNEATKNWNDFLGLQHEKMILNIKKELQSFIKTIQDLSDEMGDTLEQVNERIYGIRNEGAEMVAVSTGKFFPKLAVNIIEETQKITLEKVKALQKIDREVKTLKEDLTGYGMGLQEYLKLFSVDKQTVAQEEYNAKLELGRANLAALGADRLAIEQGFNTLLKERINLLPMEVMLTARTAAIERERESALSVQQEYADYFRGMNRRSYDSKANELEIEGKRLQLMKEIRDVTSNTQYHFADLYTIFAKSNIPLAKWEDTLKKVEEESKKTFGNLFENLYLPGDITAFNEITSQQKATVAKTAVEVADTYYESFKQEMERISKEYNKNADKAGIMGVFGGAIGADKLGFGLYEKQIKLIKELKEKAVKEGVTLDTKELEKAEDRAYWQDMSTIALAGAEQVISIWSNFAMQKSQILRELEEDQIKNKTILREQLKAGIIDQSSYDNQIATLDKNASAYRKAALLRKQADLWSGIQQTLATQAIEWAFLGAAKMIEGNIAVGGAYLALAAAAGVASPIAGANATEYGKRAARAEGKYEFMQGNGVGSSVSNKSTASTYGSTIEGQPMSVTINPSISISGELIGIGADGVGELEEGLAPLMVVAIQDAIDTGQINMNNIGKA